MIVVKNVPKALHQDDLTDAFEGCGKVLSSKLRAGTAHIEFATEKAAKSAIHTYDGGDLNGSKIRVDYA